MSEIGENLKNIVMKGIEVIGNKAGSFASNAKQKVDEFNLMNAQKDLFCAIGSKVFEMSKNRLVICTNSLYSSLRDIANGNLRKCQKTRF